MKITLPLLLLGALSTRAFAQTAPAPVPAKPLFADVPPTHWAFAAVQTLAAAGIIEGYPTTEAPTTRAVAKLSPAPKTKLAARAPIKKVAANTTR